MKKFLDVVSSPNHEITLQWPVSDARWQETVNTLHVSALTKISVYREMDDNCTIEWDEKEAVLEALVLPSDMSWPGLNGDLDVRHSNVILPNVLFHRSSNECLGREANTMQALLSGCSVAWIGLSGIGKTASTNVIMLEIIRKMVEGRNEQNPNVPEVLLVRMGSHGYIIRRSEGQWFVSENAIHKISELTDIADELSDTYGKSNVLGLIDLHASETNPSAPFPILVSAFLSDTEGEVLKTMMKSGCSLYLCDPWPKQQLEIAAAVLTHLSQDKRCVKDWETRFAYVGGLPRIVFAYDHQGYNRYRYNVESVSYFALVVKTFSNLSIYLKATSWEYVVAPFVRKGINNPLMGKRCILRKDGSGYEIVDPMTRGSLDVVEFRFLSDKVIFDVLRQIRQIRVPDQLRAMADYGIEYQMQKAVVCYGCAMTSHSDRDAMDPSLLAENWQWYYQTKTNPFQTQLSKTQVLKVLSGWNTCHAVLFARQLLHQSVSTLDETAVYKSTFVNSKVYDMLTVNHTDKMVYMFQVTNKVPIYHAISVTALHDAFEALRMFDGGVDSEYGVTYVMIIPPYEKVPDYSVCFNVDTDNTCVPFNDVSKKNKDKSYKFSEDVRRDVSKLRNVYVARTTYVSPDEN